MLAPITPPHPAGRGPRLPHVSAAVRSCTRLGWFEPALVDYAAERLRCTAAALTAISDGRMGHTAEARGGQRFSTSQPVRPVQTRPEPSNGSRAPLEHPTVHNRHENGSDLERTARSEP